MENKILPIIAGIIVVIAVCVIILLPNNDEKEVTEGEVTNPSSNSNVKSARTIEANVNENGDIEIKSDDLDLSNATFINYKTDNGYEVELVAVKNGDNIDVAFNTCQICNGSPKAYFIQKNGRLVCQNCGNMFSLMSVGQDANGCNPMTLDDTNVTKIEDGITISKEFLTQNEGLFKNVAKH